MQSKSPAIARVCSAAVAHFAERGYDAASLNEIAEAIGIRKASLYSHFSGKDELFMAVFSDALRHEQDYASQCFVDDAKTVLPGSRYCASLADRYADSVHLRFLLRTVYLPPAALREQVLVGYQSYLKQLLDDFTNQLSMATEGQFADAVVVRFGQAFLGIVDSLHVELIYMGDKNFAARLQALLQLLSDSIARHLPAA